jgi:hypothetical protein
MSEQYAFAIGFDRELEELGEGLDEGLDEGWVNFLAEVAAAIGSAGLPPIDSERWDEFGQGRVFWGTKAECESVRQVLSQFDLYIEEDRNLDPGYYATAHHTYYVDAEGEIYVLPDWSTTEHSFISQCFLKNIHAIPLDAYRLKKIDLEMDKQLQALLRGTAFQPESIAAPSSEALFAADRLSMPVLGNPVLEDSASEGAGISNAAPDVASENAALEAPLASSIGSSSPVPMVPADVYAELRTKSAQQAAQIMELEHRLRAMLIQVDQLQGAISNQVDPKVHERLKLHCDQQTQRIEALQAQLQSQAEQFATLQQQVSQQSSHALETEQALAQAQSHIQRLESEVEQAINSEVHEKVRQQTLAQAAQIQDLQQFVQRLEQQLKDAAAQSEQKVNVSKYEALEQDVADKSAMIKDLRRALQQQERDTREWQTVAEAKVDWSEHQALREELQRLQSRKKRGLFARLFDWLWN